MTPDLVKSLVELEEGERKARLNELSLAQDSLFANLKPGDDLNTDESNAHCARVVVTATVKVPGGKTLVKTGVERNCMFGAPKSEELSAESKEGNIEFKITLCSGTGKIVASEVLLLAPFILMGITAFLAVPNYS